MISITDLNPYVEHLSSRKSHPIYLWREFAIQGKSACVVGDARSDTLSTTRSIIMCKPHYAQVSKTVPQVRSCKKDKRIEINCAFPLTKETTFKFNEMRKVAQNIDKPAYARTEFDRFRMFGQPKHSYKQFLYHQNVLVSARTPDKIYIVRTAELDEADDFQGCSVLGPLSMTMGGKILCDHPKRFKTIATLDHGITTQLAHFLRKNTSK